MTASIPAGGVREALKKLADRVRALLLVDSPISWEERINIADDIDALAASLSLPAGGVAVSDAMAVGEAVEPLESSGLTVAYFKAENVPIGTKLYIAAQAALSPEAKPGERS